MRISIVGSGYVGLTTAIGLAENNNQVICIDTNEEKVRQINQGKPPFYEPGLENKLVHCLKQEGTIKASTDFKETANSDITFICVGTPCNSQGSIDLSCIKQSAEEIGKVLNKGNNYHTVVVRSTVIPGTTEKVVMPTLEKSSSMKAGRDFSVAMNPEFLQEGRAIKDFSHPDRIIIGEDEHRNGDALGEIYRRFHSPIIRTSIKTAEMIKYASNAFLATKITFINEIGNICKKHGIDVYEVANAIGQDPRIGNKFLNAGIGFGGSCLPKDVSALIHSAEELGYNAGFLQSILKTNVAQPSHLLDIARNKLDFFAGKIVTVLGLAFKPNTDDIRQAPALYIIEQLLSEGATVKVYDPMVKQEKRFPGSDKIEFSRNIPEAVSGSDCVIITTEWDEFKDESLYAGKLVFDGRRALNLEKARQICSYYEGVCW